MVDKIEKIRRKRMKEIMERQKKSEPEDKPTELTDETFATTVSKHPLVVVDCWAPWCGPCRMLSPVIDEMARDYAGKIFFGKLNVDESQGVASKYGIMSIPTLLVFKNGQLADQIVGAMPRHMLEPKLKRHVQ